MTVYKCDRCGALTADIGKLYKISVERFKYSNAPGDQKCFMPFGTSLNVELCEMCFKTVFEECKKIALGNEEEEEEEEE